MGHELSQWNLSSDKYLFTEFILHFVHYPVDEKESQVQFKQLASMLEHKEHYRLTAVVKLVN